LQQEADGPLTASDVVRRATTDGDPVAIEAVRLFATWLGRFAGDMALVYGARGGVYIAGGIPPRILSFLSDGHLRSAFEAKGQLSSYLAGIPLFLVRTQQAGLMGAALALARMRESRDNRAPNILPAAGTGA
jgi:glucokinase